MLASNFLPQAYSRNRFTLHEHRKFSGFAHVLDTRRNLR